MKPHTAHNENAKRRRRLAEVSAMRKRMMAHQESEGLLPRIIIYQSELEYMVRCTLDRNNIETGGQLFGHWTSDGTPVVLYAIGPGPNANHQVAFFQQDVEYLVKMGRLLKSRFGLHHIGEWHSHHQLGLDHPSRIDVHTMSLVRRFLLCIATCSTNKASVRGFYFEKSHYTDATWDVITVPSPIREEADRAFADVLVHPGHMHETD